MLDCFNSRRSRRARGAVDPLLERLEARVLLDSAPLPPLGALQDPGNPVVRLETPLGDIDLELFPDAAPGVVQAFISGLNRTATTSFQRVVAGEILQAGVTLDPSFYRSTGQFQQTPVTDEATIPNTMRTVGAVNFGTTNDAVTPQFYFNLSDNPELDTGPGAGIVFARVLDDRSWGIVQTIAGLGTADLDELFLPESVISGPFLGEINGPFDAVPVRETFNPAAPLANPAAFVNISDAQLIKAQDVELFFAERIYYPEGFIGGENISEFVPISNPNDQPADFQVILRRERTPAAGEVRDIVVASGTLPANSRGGVDLTTAIRDFEGGSPFQGEPYAIEIRATRPLAATLSHFDFGTAAGESFTGETSLMWAFPEAERGEDLFNFLVWHNTSGETAMVNVTFVTPLGGSSNLTVFTPAHQRGGLNIGQLNLPDNTTFGIVMTSDQPLVAALSRYDTRNDAQAGTTELGTTSMGVTSGVLPLATIGDGDDELDDDDGFSERLTFLNRANAIATVTINAAPIGPLGNPVQRTLNIPANGLANFNFADLRDALGVDNFSVTFTSDQPVIAGGVHTERGDATSTRFSSFAAEDWLIAEGFLDADRAGEDLFESLAIFNPGADTNVTVTFRFTDGTTIEQLVAVPGGESALLQLDQFEPLLAQARQGRNFFSTQVTSDQPAIVQFRHFDLTLGGVNAAGGFGTIGQTFGLVTPIMIGVPA